jgi:predicted DNA-binding transcriptional regulator AlpA
MTPVHGGIGHNQPPADDDFLGDDLLAARLNITPAHVWRLRKRGILPDPYYLGRSPRWSWREVVAALQKTKSGPREHEVRRLAEARARAREARAALAATPKEAAD